MALEKSNSKTANIYELEREGFKNPISIDEFLKTKNEKLYKCYPFDKLSFKYRWADFYRDLLII